MTPQEYRPEGKILVAAVTAVAATYGYFLIFAQFGFLSAVTGNAAAGWLKPLMAVMGAAGITGSWLAGRWFTAERSPALLIAGFGLSAAAAGLTLAGGPAAVYFVAALLVGLGAGLTTVTLAGALRPAVGEKHLGLIIGLGTGLAYAFCNLPAVFNASASTQAKLALLMAGLGITAATQLKPRTVEAPPNGYDYSPAGVSAWVLIFLGLVTLDSAAFYIIQHTSGLKADMWSGGQLAVNAGVHLVAAVLAGLALDRRWLGRTVLLAAALLVAACVSLEGNSAGSALLYTAGVSVYSVALVFYPARSLRPGLAALVYAVAGWGGSALGIGLAEGWHELPPGLLPAAGSVIFGGLLLRKFFHRPAATNGTEG